MNVPSVDNARNVVGKYGKAMCIVHGSVKTFGLAP